MSVFADTNWLEALYFEPDAEDAEGQTRKALAHRRMRRHSGQLIISHIVLLEARNVFNRLAGSAHPTQWEHLVCDFNGRIFVDPMNWDILRQETNLIFERFSHKTNIGTFDATLIASARLAGAREIFSFDEQLKALATCLVIKLFPELTVTGRVIGRRA